MQMINFHWCKRILLCLTFTLMCCAGFAHEDIYQRARILQHGGRFDEAIDAYKLYLMQPISEDSLTAQQQRLHTEALMQLMNTFQSKGEPEVCVATLKNIFKASPVIQRHCLRDYYAILGYALSRTEAMKEAEQTILKALTLPLHHATPEGYFRDYAYAAAVFYSNPHYQNEVINWCQEAIRQADLCQNTSGKQWVTAMLGSLYKQNGHLNKALELFMNSKEEAESRNDELGILNSLHKLVDLFLYWNAPEYANIYASEAVHIEQKMITKNPMISAQTYINKGRAMYQLGEIDSVAYYTEKATNLCQSLPYNSGMVDINLLNGTYLCEKDANSVELGLQELQQVTEKGTATNRAKAYHQMGQTYLKREEHGAAEAMLDSMYALLHHSTGQNYIQLEYEPILNHYLKKGNHDKVEQYLRMMLQEQRAFREKKLNFNIVSSVVDLHTEQEKQNLRFFELKQTNHVLGLIILLLIVTFAITAIIKIHLKKAKQYKQQIQHADEQISSITEQLNQTKVENEIRVQEIQEILSENGKRQDLEILTPTLLQTEGETKFRQCFELLYPNFLTKLREQVPTITRREEVLSMLIVLKQDNKQMAEHLAIAPRSVLMLRHRFRQKIGINTDLSLEDFIAKIKEIEQ